VPDRHLALQEGSEMGELFCEYLVLGPQELKFGRDLCVCGDQLLGLCLEVIDVVPLSLSKASSTFSVFCESASFTYHLLIVGLLVSLGIELDFGFFCRGS